MLPQYFLLYCGYMCIVKVLMREKKFAFLKKRSTLPPSVLLSPVHLTVAMYHRNYESAKKKKKKEKRKKEKEKIFKK